MGRAAGVVGVCSSRRRSLSGKRRDGRWPRDYKAQGAAGRSGQGAGGGRGVRTGTSAMPGGCSGEPSGEEGAGGRTGGDPRGQRGVLGGAALFAGSRSGQRFLVDSPSSAGKSAPAGSEGFGFRVKNRPLFLLLAQRFWGQLVAAAFGKESFPYYPPALKLWVLYFLII